MYILKSNNFGEEMMTYTCFILGYLSLGISKYSSHFMSDSVETETPYISLHYLVYWSIV